MKDACMRDLVCWINKNAEVGDQIIGYKLLAEQVGYDDLTIRERMAKLGCLGVVSIAHGKRTILLKDPLSEEEHF